MSQFSHPQPPKFSKLESVPDVLESRDQIGVSFRLPLDVSGPVGRGRVFPLPLTLSALQRHAIEIFNVPRFYQLALSYAIKSDTELVQQEWLLDESDMPLLRLYQREKRMTNPPCFFVHHVKWNKTNGELIARRVNKENRDADVLGAPVKLDHPGALKFKEKRRLKEIELEAERLAEEEAGDAGNSSSRHPGSSSRPRHSASSAGAADRASSKKSTSNTERRTKSSKTKSKPSAKAKSSTTKKTTAAKKKKSASIQTKSGSSKSREKRRRRDSVDDEESSSASESDESTESSDEDDEDDDDDEALPDIMPTGSGASRPKARRYARED
ncbi:hypothetical protein OC842_000152 [Tilletia horrida]|uniref:Uncharacterized protein n=1 Tax=Tilletia horrida TaxID=155126 RepID=A0AAN6GI19_9BASI|nr:hypothetical protein OC842_000152 [Tilletia horrida]